MVYKTQNHRLYLITTTTKNEHVLPRPQLGIRSKNKKYMYVYFRAHNFYDVRKYINITTPTQETEILLKMYFPNVSSIKDHLYVYNFIVSY